MNKFFIFILTTIYLLSCTPTGKPESPTDNLQENESKNSNNYDMDLASNNEEDSEENFDIDQKNYIDIAIKHLNIKQDNCILDFSNAMTLPNKKQTAVLISEYTSSKSGTEEDFSIRLHLFILDNLSKNIIGQLKENIILESSPLIIDGIYLNTESYDLTPDAIDFGITISSKTMSRGTPYSGTSTYLFLWKNDEITNILEDYSTYSNFTNWISECNFQNTIINTHFIKSAKSTSRFPDIIAVSDSTFEDIILDAEKDLITTRENRGERILKYQNGKYQ